MVAHQNTSLNQNTSKVTLDILFEMIGSKLFTILPYFFWNTYSKVLPSMLQTNDKLQIPLSTTTENIMGPVFRRFGQGFCGTVWAAPTGPGDAFAIKGEDGGPGR